MTPAASQPSATLRLHTLLVKGKAINSIDTCYQGWAELLGVQRESSGDVLRAVADFRELVRDARHELDSLPPKHLAAVNQYWGGVERIAQHRNFDEQWGLLISSVNDALLLILGVATEVLNPEPGRPIRDSLITKLQERVATLLLEVIREDMLDPDLRAALVEVLTELQRVMAKHAVLGTRGMVHAMGQIDWALRVHQGVFADNVQHATVTKTMRVTSRFVRVVDWANRNPGAVAALVGIGQIAATLSVGALPLLLAPGPPVAPQMLPSGPSPLTPA